jgi:sulfur relay (sulfurtransferase) DsrC/TusE family protein
MSQNVWGSITWLLFHSFAEKINEEHFAGIKDRFITFIKDTCFNLPCPICSNHALEVLKQSNMNLINTKADMIEFLRQFHNIVNIKLDKPIIDKNYVITHYKNVNLIAVIRQFVKAYSHKYGNYEIKAFQRANDRHLYLKGAIININIILQCCRT